MLSFLNDYASGAHPEVLKALIAGNTDIHPGYSEDKCCEAAAKIIREKTACPGAGVHFISGGTQTNLIAISSLLRPWEAVMAVYTAHINTHETGAIEGTGHKVLTRENPDGKVTPAMLESMLKEHTPEHMVKPAMVYISQTTEIGTHYMLSELEELSAFCRAHKLYLYADGARLASGLAASDITLGDLARLTDLFSIGGTKCGALFGEALVIPNPAIAPEIRWHIKNRGGMFAKGWMLGAQFEALLTGDLYESIGREENRLGETIREGLIKRGVDLTSDSHTNQIFAAFKKDAAARLAEKVVFTEERDLGDSVEVRFVTTWTTTEDDIRALLAAIDEAL